MNDGGQMAFVFPKPGRALMSVLIGLAVFGIAETLLFNWTPAGRALILTLAYTTDGIGHWQLWRLFTAGLLVSPEQPSHLIYTLIGLYFLGPDLEKRWGAGRFLRFLATSIILGYLLSFLFDLAAGPHAGSFNPGVRFGSMAAVTAITVAWSRAHAGGQVLLFLFPVSGRVLFWIAIAMCFVGLIWPGAYPEGAVAPFGGVVAGLLLGGTPSVMRELYLRARLGVLRRQSTQMGRSPGVRAGKRPRAGGPPLRVVPGGIEDELRKRQPPKDKRYLN